MAITQTVKVPIDRRVHFDFEVPHEIPTGTTARFEVVWLPVKEDPSQKKGRERGCLKGKIRMTDKFFEPLEDFKDYM